MTNQLQINAKQPLPLLSFEAALIGGQAMFDRWAVMADEPPPIARDDAAWADFFWSGYEAVRSYLMGEGG